LRPIEEKILARARLTKADREGGRVLVDFRDYADASDWPRPTTSDGML
jgi:hypothetical protein